MLSVFCSPTRYAQGRNATESLGQEIASLGIEGPALIVAGRTAIALLSETWKRSLSQAGIPHSIYRFGGECSASEIERVKAAAQSGGIRVIIGSGGGKVLDTARAAAAELLLPLINCPTVASSDAPCSALSVVYTDAGAFESYRIYRRNPDLVLVDTQVIAGAPARLLVAGMGDALATWFEAKASAGGRVRNMRGGASTESALGLAELCYRTLLANGAEALSAVETHVVTPALERIVEANTLLSGLGFESSGLAAAHAVHNGLTAVAQTHPYLHGEKVAFGVLVQLILEGQPRALLSEVMEFAAEVGLPIRLADIGLVDVPRDVIERIADRTTAPAETIHNEPFDVEPPMVVDAIRAADSAGRAWYNRRHSSMTGSATAKHDKSEATPVDTTDARSATAVPSLSSGATEEQMNARGTVPQRIDKLGSKVEDLAGTGQQDAPGG
jgi:glycerol dehydrogenase